MNIITREELKTLAERSDEPCVSIYLPLHHAGADIQKDPIRLRNLLREAGERLMSSGMRQRDADALLGPIYDLFENNRLFWRSPSRGLAIFRSREFLRYYRLPLEFGETAIVNTRFYLKPLLQLFSGNGRFYVLALSRSTLRLMEATRFDIREISPGQMPGSLAEALRYDEFEAQLQFAGANMSGERRSTIFHGHTAEPDSKENLLRYFQMVDRALRDLLRNEQAPLVLAGVRYLHPIYREASTYPHLIENGIAGGTADLRLEELHEQAWRIIEPYFRTTLDEAMEQYNNLAGTGRTSADLSEVVPAACGGRINTLFIDDRTRLFGTYDPAAAMVHVAQEAHPGAEELSDLAAVHTLLNGGMVYPVGSHSVPGGAPMAALFRY